ncbi:hypothetical protein BR93DRAFT_927687 [Coniochaeta sp. PMI_546]|nr:hypothetical protein BR93DRAFT_927687 [Coniochaeta sp. PMI_546]
MRVRAGEVVPLLDRHAGLDHPCPTRVDPGDVLVACRATCRNRRTDTDTGAAVAVVVVVAVLAERCLSRGWVLGVACDDVGIGGGGGGVGGVMATEMLGGCGVLFGEGVGDVVACFAAC